MTHAQKYRIVSKIGDQLRLRRDEGVTLFLTNIQANDLLNHLLASMKGDKKKAKASR